MHPQASEDWLVQRAVQRDKAAFATLYDSHMYRVYRHVYYRVSNQIDAEDITQEVFIRAWKAINKYKKTGAPFVTWLLAIAHNLIVDHYRARKNLVSLEEAEASNQTAEASPEAMAEASFNKGYVRHAVLRLKEEKQKVILMRFIDGLSYGEIAKVLNKSEGAVRVIQCRALNDLKHMLMSSE
ncbi:MAG: sigma-70 family RNA polymerase sigma factor [Dehalococcoidia bacterium]|nr:sigma-70 family RNA polymerase sigma factor [Dehalococcoidia bacterium]